jgi:hypothetical protein
VSRGPPRAGRVDRSLHHDYRIPNPELQVAPLHRATFPGPVRMVFDGKVLGSFEPVTEIGVNTGAGNDAVLVDPLITLPSRIDGAPGTIASKAAPARIARLAAVQALGYLSIATGGIGPACVQAVARGF